MIDDVKANRRRANLVLVLLTAIYMFNTMDRNIYAILAEPVRRELALSDTQLGLLTGLTFALFYTFFGVPVGWLADRIGRVRVIVIACAIWSVCSAAGGLATRFSHLALSRMGVGIGEAGGAAPSYSLISTFYPPDKRGNALGVFHVGSSIGMLVSSTVSAWVASQYGWRVALAVISLPGLAFAIILFLTVKEPPRDAAAPASGSLWSSIAVFARDPLLRLTALTAGVSSFTGFGMSAWLPSFLMRVKGMTLPQVGTYYGLPYALFFGVGLWSAGYIADRLARRTPASYALVPCVALFLAAPGIVIATSLPGWIWSFAAFLFPLMFAQMFLAPMLTIIQNHSRPDQRSISAALFLFVNNLVGAGFGPLYVGTISDAFKATHGADSLRFGMLALAPVALIGACAQLLIVRKLRQMARGPVGDIGVTLAAARSDLG